MNLIDRIVDAEPLDRPAGAAASLVHRLLANRRVKDALHGVWLGHPLHPALAQLTLSTFTAASLIDATGGDRRDSSRLIAIGAAAYVPTIAAGWADYSEAHEEQQRLGIVHAGLNIAAYTGFLGVLALRARGRSGRALSVVAGSISGLAAALGGHLGYRLALGANHAEHVAHVGPGQWQRLGPVAELPEGEPVRRRAGELAVLVLRRDGQVHVLSDTCPHLAGPMSEGELGADATIVCPWHGSTFRVDGGEVVHGPATAPLPCFETRVVDGTLQVKVRPAG